MLEHLYKSAYNAYRGTSFDTEKRAAQTLKSYEEVLQDDLNQISEATAEIKEQYKQRFIKFFTAWLSSRSRIMSTMITGASNFPVRRMQKYNGVTITNFDDCTEEETGGNTKEVVENNLTAELLKEANKIAAN
jgi:hypothetical protein